MRRWWAIWMAVPYAFALPAAPKNLAVQLGYPESARLLILHADDLGMCHDGNVAAREAFQSGAISSGSVMVPCPWFPEFAAWARENPDWDVGIHLTLTSEWKYYRWGPVAPREQVPGLIDAEGFLHRDVRSVVEHATAQEVEIECRAQIERALQFGLRPTHLDSHMGTLFARADFFEVYYRLGVEYGIPVMLPRPTPEVVQRFRERGQPVPEPIVQLVRQGPLPVLDALDTGHMDADYQTAFDAYAAAVRSLRPGVTQIILHLGHGGEEMQAIAGSWKARWNDFRIVTSDAFRQLLQEEGVELLSWRTIGKLVDSQER